MDNRKNPSERNQNIAMRRLLIDMQGSVTFTLKPSNRLSVHLVAAENNVHKSMGFLCMFCYRKPNK